MTTSLPRSAIIKLAGSALLVAAALSLAACETTGAGTAAPAAQAAPAATGDNPMAPDTVTKSKGPMTHRQAALYCWMSTEHGHADLPLDKRANIVDKCIAQKMKGN